MNKPLFGILSYTLLYSIVGTDCVLIFLLCPGVCWKSLPGGGFLVSKSWSFSDPTSMYLYPDCRTALLGSFTEDRLEAAREAEVRTMIRIYRSKVNSN